MLIQSRHQVEPRASLASVAEAQWLEATLQVAGQQVVVEQNSWQLEERAHAEVSTSAFHKRIEVSPILPAPAISTCQTFL